MSKQTVIHPYNVILLNTTYYSNENELATYISKNESQRLMLRIESKSQKKKYSNLYCINITGKTKQYTVLIYVIKL